MAASYSQRREAEGKEEIMEKETGGLTGGGLKEIMTQSITVISGPNFPD